MSLISRRRFLQSSTVLLGAASIPPSLAATSNLDLSFLAIGDWGKPTLVENAKRVARQMGIAAAALEAQFVISTGDNFYEGGVADTSDPLWQAAFEDIYTAPALDCPWYVVLGNHDYRGSPDAEIAYSLKGGRWRMPARYYSVRQRLADDSSADFFYLDTTPFDDINFANRWFGAGAATQAQLDWLETELTASDARWKIVVGHHPVFSGGVHGNTQELVDRLRPMLERHGVQVYINGHDHDLQHIEVDGIHYLTSGAGAENRPVEKIAGTLFAQGTLGFLSVTMAPETMSIAFVGDDGAILHSAAIGV